MNFNPDTGKQAKEVIFSRKIKVIAHPQLVFKTNHLISTNQSGFKPGGSCINQFLSITHEIYASFNEGHVVQGVFFDMSKAFDNAWHEGLIFKLKQNGISDELLCLIKDFISDRKQQVILNGQCSSSMNVQEGVPQGSIIRPLFF